MMIDNQDLELIEDISDDDVNEIITDPKEIIKLIDQEIREIDRIYESSTNNEVSLDDINLIPIDNIIKSLEGSIAAIDQMDTFDKVRIGKEIIQCRDHYTSVYDLLKDVYANATAIVDSANGIDLDILEDDAASNTESIAEADVMNKLRMDDDIKSFMDNYPVLLDTIDKYVNAIELSLEGDKNITASPANMTALMIKKLKDDMVRKLDSIEDASKRSIVESNNKFKERAIYHLENRSNIDYMTNKLASYLRTSRKDINKKIIEMKKDFKRGKISYIIRNLCDSVGADVMHGAYRKLYDIMGDKAHRDMKITAIFILFTLIEKTLEHERNNGNYMAAYLILLNLYDIYVDAYDVSDPEEYLSELELSLLTPIVGFICSVKGVEVLTDEHHELGISLIVYQQLAHAQRSSNMTHESPVEIYDEKKHMPVARGSSKTITTDISNDPAVLDAITKAPAALDELEFINSAVFNESHSDLLKNREEV